ncbi:PilW family protein [Marinicella sediminis]|uniref:PilW family protein n=1 Tax=Marinicella sediminis TaxID=1792834 RepID=A0ABV7JG31_9GAMM|nr:PilW family protein [Marinicella sediminis]
MKKPLFKNRHTGFTLIELMVALVIGLIVMLGLVQIFSNVTSMNVAQNGLARLQENGRFMMMRMKNDIEAISHQPCASISMDSPQVINEGFAVRPLYSAIELDNGLPSPGLIDPQYLIQGHECGVDGSCSPELNIQPGGHQNASIPNSGTSAGSRARFTDVLTMRVLTGGGVLVDDTVTPSTDTSVTLSESPTGPTLNLEDGDDVLIANCYKALISTAQPVGNNRIAISQGLIDSNASVSWASKNSMTQVYNFSKDFDTISYYVGLKNDPSTENRLISSLYRVENGEAPVEVIEGVERFDVSYGVRFNDGTMGYLTADDIQSAFIPRCVTPPLVPADMGLDPMENTAGCLWRSVFAVRLHVLLNTVYNSSPSDSESYVYSVDGFEEQLPNQIPSGLDPGKMYRREFTETIALNSNNL